MEQEQTKRARRRSAEIKVLLESFSKSNMVVKDFCIHHRISEASFYKWRSRYGNASAAKKNNFVMLQKSSPVESNLMLFAEVKGIRIYQVVAASYLKELLV